MPVFMHLLRGRRLWVNVLALAGAVGLVAVPAYADTSASVTATIPVAAQIKSVSVNPQSITFTSCGPSGSLGSGTALTLPNGSCSAPGITVTSNGTVPETIDVWGFPATPSDAGTAWLPTPNTTTPGQDNYSLKLSGSTAVWVGVAPLLDANAPNGGLNVPPGSNFTESPQIYAPSASTDPSTTFTTTVMWLAS